MVVEVKLTEGILAMDETACWRSLREKRIDWKKNQNPRIRDAQDVTQEQFLHKVQNHQIC